MTLSAFDIGMVKNYNEPKYLITLSMERWHRKDI